MFSYNKLYFQYKKLYSSYLDKTISILNNYHNKQYDKHYWEPIIGLYLRSFIIKYHFFRKINKKNNFKNGTLKNIEFNRSFSDFSINHNYILYKFQNIISNKSFKFKKINFITGIINSSKTLIPNLLINLKILKIFFTDSYFKKKTKNIFTIKSLFNLYPLPSLNCENYRFNKKTIFQNRINLIYLSNKKNKKDIFFHNLIISMPINYVENYAAILKEVKKINISEALYTDGDEVKFDYVKFYIAELKIKNKKIFVGQHSLRTGLEDFNIYFDYLKSFFSLFLTWGWNRKENKLIPFSSMRVMSSVSKYKKIKKVNNHNLNVCYILCDYPGSDDCIYENQIENFKAERARISFLKEINKIQNLSITLKPRDNSFLIDNKKQFYNKFELLQLNTRMYNVLNHYNIILFERVSLGIAECIYLNQPTILYYPKNLYIQKNKKYNELIFLLKKANIFFDDKNKVSKLISSQTNISLWWKNKKNFENRKKFLKEFAAIFEYSDLSKLKKLI